MDRILQPGTVVGVPEQAGDRRDELSFMSCFCHSCRDQFGQLVLGDVIQGINGKPVKTQRDLFEILDGLRPGDSINLLVNRNGQQKEISLVLGGREGLPLDQ